VDATLVLAHSEKGGATGTRKKTFGFHPVRREALNDSSAGERPPPPTLSQQAGVAEGSPDPGGAGSDARAHPSALMGRVSELRHCAH
jgi:hypothetical protein